MEDTYLVLGNSFKDLNNIELKPVSSIKNTISKLDMLRLRYKLIGVDVVASTLKDRTILYFEGDSSNNYITIDFKSMNRIEEVVDHNMPIRVLFNPMNNINMDDDYKIIDDEIKLRVRSLYEQYEVEFMGYMNYYSHIFNHDWRAFGAYINLYDKLHRQYKLSESEFKTYLACWSDKLWDFVGPDSKYEITERPTYLSNIKLSKLDFSLFSLADAIVGIYEIYHRKNQLRCMYTNIINDRYGTNQSELNKKLGIRVDLSRALPVRWIYLYTFIETGEMDTSLFDNLGDDYEYSLSLIEEQLVDEILKNKFYTLKKLKIAQEYGKTHDSIFCKYLLQLDDNFIKSVFIVNYLDRLFKDRGVAYKFYELSKSDYGYFWYFHTKWVKSFYILTPMKRDFKSLNHHGYKVGIGIGFYDDYKIYVRVIDNQLYIEILRNKTTIYLKKCNNYVVGYRDKDIDSVVDDFLDIIKLEYGDNNEI